MYLTEMIKPLPTQSGRYLAPAEALSHVLKRQQHRPKILYWLQGKKHSKVNREGFAKFTKGAFSTCLLGPTLLSTGQRGSRIDSHWNQCPPPLALAQFLLAEVSVSTGLAAQ